jgi:lysophospholipase L1-like esterase
MTSNRRLWPRRLPAARNLLISVLAACAALVIAELALGWSGLAPPPGLFTVSEGEFQRVPGIFAPNQRVVEQPNTQFAHVTTIDSLGYRGRHIPRIKPPGELRVLYVGDSFTWGHNVGDAETLPAQLEARLMAHCGVARVINAGLSGSTILGQAALAERGLVMDPDVVILMFHENDIDELLNVRIWDQLAMNRRAKSRFPLGAIYPLVRESALWRLTLDATRTRRLQAGLASTPATPPDAGPAAGREEYRDRLLALASRLEEAGVPFLFAAFPHPKSVAEGRGGADYAWVVDAAASAGLEVVDLLETLLESGESVEDMFLVPLDYHPSPLGHAVAADRISRVLLRLGAVPCGG